MIHGQRQLGEFSNSPLSSPAGFDGAGGCTSMKPSRPLTVKEATFSVLHLNGELFAGVMNGKKGAKRALMMRVEALLGHTADPGTVDRRVREYKQFMRWSL